MTRKIDHIGIAVKNLEETLPFYRDVLGLEYMGTEEVVSQKVRVAMFQIGESRIELLEPTSSESPIAVFLDKKGQGIHHIAYRVDDLEKDLENMKGKNIDLIDRKPRTGACGSSIAFIHPRSSGRVLTELCQHSSGKGEKQV
jgi:methylmalonyl-CoA/ethylmalonyl-CoA epimerase